jgi:hypothetical protein
LVDTSVLVISLSGIGVVCPLPTYPLQVEEAWAIGELVDHAGWHDGGK